MGAKNAVLKQLLRTANNSKAVNPSGESSFTFEYIFYDLKIFGGESFDLFIGNGIKRSGGKSTTGDITEFQFILIVCY